MRVGIVTFINTINYGASLQAFALQEVLRNRNIQAEIVQYTNEQIEQKEKNTGSRKNLKTLLRSLVMGNGIQNKTKAFQAYEEKNICFGKELNEATVEQVNNYYDAFITGSDQVWNMSIIHEDWTYFLDFVKDDHKKISYAPSFGNNPFPEEDSELTAQYLSKIRALSVREESGKKRISELCGREADVVMDPTLLLDKKQWSERIQFVPDLDHYILVYFPHNKKMVFDFVKKLKKKTGLPVVYLSISPRIQFGVKTIYDASPDEFLGWVKHADYIVTGSFHGTAFSLNLEKQFFYEPSGEGSRIDNLVKLSGTAHRSILEEYILDNVIDYSEVRDSIEAARVESLQWLYQALEG